MSCWQGLTALIVAFQVTTHQGPLQRAGVLPVFFLGAAELTSGLTGL